MKYKFNNNLYFFISIFALTGCSAQNVQSIPSSWKNDCVGRMQVALPGAAEIATTPDNYFLSLLGLKPTNSSHKYEFPDGLGTSYTSLGYSFANILISHLQSREAVELALKAHVTQRFNNAKNTFAKSVQTDGSPYVFAITNTDLPNTAIWQVSPFRFNALINLTDRLVDLNISLPTSSSTKTTDDIKNFLTSFKSRPLYDVPSVSGVCLPYVFVNDDGKKNRNIQISYRLIDHPDIQITIKDQTSVARESGVRNQNAEPLAVIQSLWDQHLTTFAKEGKNEWASGGHTVTLAGYQGLSSFVKFVRNDDLIDYGYVAVVRGDPNAQNDTPDLMLYVIRDSHNAKGKEPMPKDEFLKMAETIAASIKRRPVE
jgi:hypothetical protein